MLKSLSALALCVIAGAAIHAQTVRTPVAPPSMATVQADMLKWQSAMMAAQAAAIKPGDEALPCEALDKELVSKMNNPVIQAYAAKIDATNATELAARKKGVMRADTAAALAAALTPGAGMAGMAAMPPIAPGQQMTPQQIQQAMMAQQQASIAYMNQLAPIMPALMRSQRVTMLAMAKNCPWATGSLGLYPGAVVPGVVRPGAVPR